MDLVELKRGHEETADSSCDPFGLDTIGHHRPPWVNKVARSRHDGRFNVVSQCALSFLLAVETRLTFVPGPVSPRVQR